MGLIFFGFVLLIESYLVRKSGFLPPLIGALMQLAGACYLINSVALLRAPDIASLLFPAILVPCFIAEMSFALWMLIKGVNVREWTRRASASRGDAGG